MVLLTSHFIYYGSLITWNNLEVYSTSGIDFVKYLLPYVASLA